MDVFSMEKPTNLAHTTAALPFHMDNCWYESPPGLQFLHCIRLDMSIYCKTSRHLLLSEHFAMHHENHLYTRLYTIHVARADPWCFHVKRESSAAYSHWVEYIYTSCTPFSSLRLDNKLVIDHSGLKCIIARHNIYVTGICRKLMSLTMSQL